MARGLWVASGTRQCDRCSTEYVPYTERQRYCSRQCGWLHRAAIRPKNPDWLAGRQVERPVKCLGCAADGVSRSWNWYCGSCAAERDRSKNRRKNTARRAVISGDFTVGEIGDRDGWRCHICGHAVNKLRSGLHPKGPTIDHLVPIAHGGSDTRENVALAHRLCNTRRGTGGVVQLRLVS